MRDQDWFLFEKCDAKKRNMVRLVTLRDIKDVSSCVAKATRRSALHDVNLLRRCVPDVASVSTATLS